MLIGNDISLFTAMAITVHVYELSLITICKIKSHQILPYCFCIPHKYIITIQAPKLPPLSDQRVALTLFQKKADLISRKPTSLDIT